MKDDIASYMDSLAPQEQINDTTLPDVKIHRTSVGMQRTPLCYRQGIYIVGNGTKRVYLGNRTYSYGTNNYLVMTVPLPGECDGEASPEDPLLGMMIDIDLSLIHEIIDELETGPNDFTTPAKADALFVSTRTEAMQDAVRRLLQALQTPAEARLLGPGIVREIWYRVMCGENAASLYALATKNSHLARIDRALKQIHTHYQDNIDVDALAALVHMSPSAFHRAFKEVTATSPIQYLKRIRLDRAHMLLLEQGLRVHEAASSVGYESATQFSREFKRIFGQSPVDVLRRAG